LLLVFDSKIISPAPSGPTGEIEYGEPKTKLNRSDARTDVVVRVNVPIAHHPLLVLPPVTMADPVLRNVPSATVSVGKTFVPVNVFVPFIFGMFVDKAASATLAAGSETAPALTEIPFEKLSVPLWVLLPLNALAPFFSATFEDKAESATLAAGSETAPALTVRPFEKVSVPLCVLLPLKALAPFTIAAFANAVCVLATKLSSALRISLSYQRTQFVPSKMNCFRPWFEIVNEEALVTKLESGDSKTNIAAPPDGIANVTVEVDSDRNERDMPSTGLEGNVTVYAPLPDCRM
jgi:hypothetical protein